MIALHVVPESPGSLDALVARAEAAAAERGCDAGGVDRRAAGAPERTTGRL